MGSPLLPAVAPALTARISKAADAKALAPNLRKSDLKELSVEPEAALLGGLAGTCFTVFEGEEPICMFGTVAHSHVSDAGIVWLLSSDRLLAHRREFLRATPAVLAAFHSRYPVLMNHVHVENDVHVRWLRWAGFTFINRFDLPSGSFYEFVHV
jgi:hypothetical protein